MEPFVIEVTRGGRVESRHRGMLAVVDGDGRSVLRLGDVDRGVFPRSAVKVLQALPFIESGAADAFGMSDAELSLACASHSGEEGHASLAAGMLERAGLTADALECGCHWPFELPVALDLARAGGAPTQLHNNCSGKHAGFLCTCVHLGEDPSGYVRAGHPAQRRVRAVFEALTGLSLDASDCGIDGCAIPTYAAPLHSYARAFARLATGTGVPAERAAAGQRLMRACMAEPWAMSGTKRACLSLMEAAPGRVFVKTGAEGVFCGAVPELGLGIALKVEDGATRASQSAIAACLARIMRPADASLAERYEAMSRVTLRNWNGQAFGEIRASGFDA